MKHPGDLTVPDSSVRAQIVPLRSVPAEWDKAWADLAAHASEPNPFAEHWFMRPAIAQLTRRDDDRMLAVWRDSALLGMIPLTISARYGRLPLRHVENWMHYHCFYGAPLIRAGSEDMFWAAAFAALDSADWAPSFLHLVCLDPTGPVFETLRNIRRADIVHSTERALLSSSLDAETYYTSNIRQKKRKELRRLRTRLDELGDVSFYQLGANSDVDIWIADFLALEASGWKGREGSALAGDPQTKAFFEAALRQAHGAAKLDMLRMTLDGKPIAMLVNFLSAPGCFAFKIAFDEAYARFSPGVLIKIENLKVLDNPAIDWVDSCAVEDHRMINSLWAERRRIVRVTVPLAGKRRKLVFQTARMIENAAAKVRGR